MFSVLWAVASLWPYFYGAGFLKNNKELVATWTLSCAAMSSFTLLPAMKTEDINLMYVISCDMLFSCVLTEPTACLEDI